MKFGSKKFSDADGIVLRFFDCISAAAAGAAIIGLADGRLKLFALLAVIAASFLLLEIFWSPIRKQVAPGFGTSVRRIASYQHYWKRGGLLLLLFVIWYNLYDLRTDLNTYAMPRRLSDGQKKALTGYLSEHKEHEYAVTINFDAKDTEARRYGKELSWTLEQSRWRVSNGNDADPQNQNPGVCIHEAGTSSKNFYKMEDPKLILEKALRETNIIISNCNMNVSSGAYELFLLNR